MNRNPTILDHCHETLAAATNGEGRLENINLLEERQWAPHDITCFYSLDAKVKNVFELRNDLSKLNLFFRIFNGFNAGDSSLLD